MPHLEISASDFETSAGLGLAALRIMAAMRFPRCDIEANAIRTAFVTKASVDMLLADAKRQSLDLTFSAGDLQALFNAACVTGVVLDACKPYVHGKKDDPGAPILGEGEVAGLILLELIRITESREGTATLSQATSQVSLLLKKQRAINARSQVLQFAWRNFSSVAHLWAVSLSDRQDRSAAGIGFIPLTEIGLKIFLARAEGLRESVHGVKAKHSSSPLLDERLTWRVAPELISEIGRTTLNMVRKFSN